ncbi:MAG: T9SS type A sorting domain-containing protein [Prolixibacteraceae bacterium]|jgi:rhamnogalacturonan endolyase|nr:T9SS type A sorting domain-containing protein [Prolixibacteraceae bacterium]
MNRTLFLKQIITGIFIVLFFTNVCNAQRPMEYLNRALVVQEQTDASGTYLTWRMLGTDPRDIYFNIYRDGKKINATPITGSTNYTDNSGNITSDYQIEAIFPGMESKFSEYSYKFPLSNISGRPRVPINRISLPAPPVIAGTEFTPGEMSTGDLNGDGSYELVFEWESNTGMNSFLEAIDLEGNSLWRISAGPNVTTAKLNFMVYDLNEDGKAEVSFLSGPGTIDGTGKYIKKGPAADYPHDLVIDRPSGRLMDDPQFITVFNGETGEEMATTEHWPPIGPRNLHDATWGDNYGHRASSLKGAVLYNKDLGPVLVFLRGIYTRIGMGAYKWDGGSELTRIWTFDTEDPDNPQYREYRGQGNHTVSVGDLDGDGNDELIIGAAAIDDDGTGLYNTRMGHGDANHLADHIPDRPGLEFYQPHENGTYGISMRDAGTGEIIWEVRSSADVGRAWAADIDSRYRGSEVIAIGFPNYDCNGNEITTSYNAYNQPIYFDGEVQRGWRGQGWALESAKHGRILNGWYYGASPIHGSKDDANLVADILGDWREEVVFRTSDNRELIIFSSWFPTERKNPTLMHDPTYRMNITTQNVGYNQSAHTGYYFADGYPTHNITMIEKDLSKMSTGNYFMMSVHAPLVVEATDNISLQAQNESANQVWRFQKQQDGYYIYNWGADQYLGFTSTENGSSVILTDEASKQLFQIFKKEDSQEYFIAPAGIDSLVVAAFEASSDAGTTLILVNKSGADHELFTFTNAGNQLDCNNVWNGNAFYDNCGICVEGNTGFGANTEDIENGYYKISPVDSEFCIEIGSNAFQSACKNGNSQILEIKKEGIYYQISSIEPVRYFENIRNIFVASTVKRNTSFRIEKITDDAGEDIYAFTAENPEFVLGIENDSQEADAALTMYSRYEHSSWKFELEKLNIDETDCDGVWKGGAYIDDCGRCVEGNTGLTPCISDFGESYYEIIPVNSNLYLEPGNNNVTQNEFAESNSQLWAFESEENGYNKIRNAETDEYIYASAATAGSAISMSSTASSEFMVLKNANHYYISPSTNHDVRFDVLDVSTEPGANIIFWTYHDGDNQKFLLEPKEELYSNETSARVIENGFKVYPNPVNNQLNLILNGEIAKNARFEMYNASGKLILSHQIKIGNTHIETDNMKQGLYFLQVFNGERVHTVKIHKR